MDQVLPFSKQMKQLWKFSAWGTLDLQCTE